MNARKNTVKNIPPDILSTHHPNRGICSKEPHCRFCNELNKNGYQNTKSCRNHDSISKGLSCPVLFACTNILGAKRRYRGQHGRWYQEQEADHFFHNSYRSRRA